MYNFLEFVNHCQQEIHQRIGTLVDLHNIPLGEWFRPKDHDHLSIKIDDNPLCCHFTDWKDKDNNFTIFPPKPQKIQTINNSLMEKSMDRKVLKINKTELKTPHLEHPYLIKKGVASVAGTELLEQYGDYLVVPLKHMGTGIVCARKLITPKGDKFFDKGSKPNSTAFHIPGRKRIYYLVEGIATGLTIKKFVPEADIYVCDSCNNVKNVLKYLLAQVGREKTPIVIAADNDWETEKKSNKNPGLKAARDCLDLRDGSKYDNIYCVYPKFAEQDLGCSDWNDFMQKYPNIDAKLMGDHFLNHQISHSEIKKYEENRKALKVLQEEARKYVREKVDSSELLNKLGTDHNRIRLEIIAKNSLVEDLDEIERGEIISFEGHFYTKTPHTTVKQIYTNLKGKSPFGIASWHENKRGHVYFGNQNIADILSEVDFIDALQVKHISGLSSMPWINEVISGKILNSYRKPKYHSSSDIPGAVAKLDKLMNYVLNGDQKNIMWLKNWFAAIVQNPGQPLMKVPFLIGPRGCGKSTLTTCFQSVLGFIKAPFKASTLFDDDQARFALEPLVTDLLVVVDEFAFKKSYTDAIKIILGNDHVRYENKGVKAKFSKRIANLIFSANPSAQTLAGMQSDERIIVPMVNNKVLDISDRQNIGEFCHDFREEIIDRNTNEDNIYNTPKKLSCDLYHYFNEWSVDRKLLMMNQIEAVMATISQELTIDEEVMIKRIQAKNQMVFNLQDDFIGSEPTYWQDKLIWEKNVKFIKGLTNHMNKIFTYCGYYRVYINEYQGQRVRRYFWIDQSIPENPLNKQMILEFFANKTKR